jgi:hypothetical protein
VPFVSGSAVAFANASVFGHLALAANLGVIVDPEILRFGIGGLFYLNDDTITLALRKRGSGNQGVARLFEIERGFAGRGFRDHFHDLFSGSDQLHIVVVEGDADFLVRLDEELGVQRLGFEDLASFGTGNWLMVMILCREGKGGNHGQNGQDASWCFHSRYWFGGK